MKKLVFPFLACSIGLMTFGQVVATPFIVAHRGASGEAPENTLPAFRLAWEQGADAIEGDFHLTADGEIVCLHDFDTAKVSGVKWLVADKTLAELSSLEVGSWFGEAFSGTRIPTLQEVMATVPTGKRLFVEVKCGPEILPRLLEIFEGSPVELSRITVISFKAEVIAGLKERAPAITAYWLTSLKQDEEGAIRPSIDEAMATLREIKADGISTSARPYLDTAYISPIREAGFSYHVWTVDDPSEAARLLGCGAQSITTNLPGRMRAGLVARP